jgi:hypothetical protein
MDLDRERGVKKGRDLNKLKIIIFGICGVLIIALLVVAGVRSLRENAILKDASNQFVIHINPEVPGASINSTLIKLQEEYERLSTKYQVPDLEKLINIELYPDVESMRADGIVPTWGDACITDIFDDVKIYLPAEIPSTGSFYTSSQFNNPRYAHEFTHFIIHTKIGPDSRAVLPLWFDEGIAELESHRGIINRHRLLIRLDLWFQNLYHPDLLEDGEFIISSDNYPDNNIDIFYSASYEFVRYINSRYEGAVQRIVNRLAIGETFTDAFENETGKSVFELYKEWYDAFF